MLKLVSTAAMLALATTAAYAQAPQPRPHTQPPTAQTQPMPPAERSAPMALNSIPANSATITHWHKQSVYDPGDNKIGEVDDVLIDREGKATALILGVGGFLGIGEKSVAVPFNAVRVTTKDNNKWYLVMNSTKDALKTAKGFKYDRNAMAWVAEDAPATTGSQPAPAPRQAR